MAGARCLPRVKPPSAAADNAGMEPALSFDPAQDGTLEIPSLSTFDRVAGSILALAGAAMLTLLAIALPYRGHEIA